jgi:hypothetical protein
MTPLEAARKILDEGPLLGQTSDDYRSWYTCVFCVAEQEWADDFPHKPDCPWKQMPQIVAALEEAEPSEYARYAVSSKDDPGDDFLGAILGADFKVVVVSEPVRLELIDWLIGKPA